MNLLKKKENKRGNQEEQEKASSTNYSYNTAYWLKGLKPSFLVGSREFSIRIIEQYTLSKNPQFPKMHRFMSIYL